MLKRSESNELFTKHCRTSAEHLAEGEIGRTAGVRKEGRISADLVFSVFFTFCMADDTIFFMRISPFERESIRQVVLSHYKDAKIYLFGSRVDDDKKGGDIDLLILTRNPALEKTLRLKAEIKGKIGDQRIDILMKASPDDPFSGLILENAILI